jgi:L-fucose mutarotase
MLKNISSVISPDLLWLLASMGHGDDLVLVDRNFPAIQVAKQTSTGRRIELPGLNIPQATRAILSLMPLDHFAKKPDERDLKRADNLLMNGDRNPDRHARAVNRGGS